MADSTETAPTTALSPETAAPETASASETALAPAARSNENRSTTPGSEGFKDFISGGWAERTDELPPAREQAPFAAARRDRVSRQFPGQRLIVPAGRLKQRANDTDYPFRAHSAFEIGRAHV